MSNKDPISFSPEQWHIVERLARAREEVEDRRFALDRAVNWYRNTHAGVVVAEAPVHLAAVFYAYIHDGTLPDAEEVEKSARDLTESLVRGAIPPAARPGSLA